MRLRSYGKVVIAGMLSSILESIYWAISSSVTFPEEAAKYLRADK